MNIKFDVGIKSSIFMEPKFMLNNLSIPDFVSRLFAGAPLSNRTPEYREQLFSINLMKVGVWPDNRDMSGTHSKAHQAVEHSQTIRQAYQVHDREVADAERTRDAAVRRADAAQRQAFDAAAQEYCTGNNGWPDMKGEDACYAARVAETDHRDAVNEAQSHFENQLRWAQQSLHNKLSSVPFGN